ncbi:MAG: CYTH domain-containing protein [Candidatus Omnitrophota bacterium]
MTLRNIEIKARIPEMYHHRDPRLGQFQRMVIQQDIYVKTADPELRDKLRTERTVPVAEPGKMIDDDGSDEKAVAMRIRYRRPTVAGARMSEYGIVRYDGRSPDEVVKAFLEECGQPIAIINKARRIFIREHTRVHLDVVTKMGATEPIVIGNFIELETVLSDGLDAAAGSEEAERIAADLNISTGSRIAGSYADM